MKEIEKVVNALQEAWRDVTFAGIVRIPFPASVQASTEIGKKFEDVVTATLIESARSRVRRDSVPSGL